MPRIETDLSAWPLVVVTMPPVDVPDAEVERFIDGQRTMLARRQKHAVLADARRARPVSARQRKMMADWLAESKSLSAEHTVAMAMVIDSAIIRGALTAVLWLAQPAAPTKVVATMEEGYTWCLEALRSAGVPGLAAVEAYRHKLARAG